MKLIKSSVATLSLLASPTAVFAQTINNPTNVSSLGDLFVRIFSLLIGIVGAIAIIFLILGGIRYIMAQGDDKATASARNQITAAIVGLVIALLAVVVVTIVGNLLGAGNLRVIPF